MNTEIRQLYIRFCVVVRAILTHPDCTNSLLLTLGRIFTRERNDRFDGPKHGAATSVAKIVHHALALTFGLHEDLEETEAHAVALPKPAKDSVPLASLFAEFGDVAGQIIEHPDVLVGVSDAMHEVCVDVTNESNHHPGHHVAWAQYFTPHCLALLAGLSVHAPVQDEARRTADILIAENARLRLLFEQAQTREMEALQRATAFERMFTPAVKRAPNTDGPHITEEKMREWCDGLVVHFDGETAPIDGLILLLWNVTHQGCHLDCIDLALRLIAHLYGQTVDSFTQCEKYLHSLPGKTYRQAEETPAQSSTATA
jgi:hypothetical protein